MQTNLKSPVLFLNIQDYALLKKAQDSNPYHQWRVTMMMRSFSLETRTTVCVFLTYILHILCTYIHTHIHINSCDAILTSRYDSNVQLSRQLFSHHHHHHSSFNLYIPSFKSAHIVFRHKKNTLKTNQLQTIKKKISHIILAARIK